MSKKLGALLKKAEQLSTKDMCVDYKISLGGEEVIFTIKAKPITPEKKQVGAAIAKFVRNLAADDSVEELIDSDIDDFANAFFDACVSHVKIDKEKVTRAQFSELLKVKKGFTMELWKDFMLDITVEKVAGK